MEILYDKGVNSGGSGCAGRQASLRGRPCPVSQGIFGTFAGFETC